MRPILALLLLFASVPVVSAQTAFTAQLTGNANVPPVTTAAKGVALAVLDPATSTVDYQADFTGLAGSVIAAEVRLGAVGTSGQVIFALAGVAPHFEGKSPALTASQVAELQANHAYLTVRTTTWPGGQVRGQLTLGANQFYALLTGGKAVPPSPTTIVGYANFGLLSNGVQLTCMIHAFSGGGTAVLRLGGPGSTGTTIAAIPFDFAGVWHAVVALDPVRIEMLKSGLVYVEVTSTSGTEVVRGQLNSTFAQFGAGSGKSQPPVFTAAGTPSPNSYVSLTLKGGAPFSFALLLVSPNAGLVNAAGCPLYVSLPAALTLVVPLDTYGSGYLSVAQLPATTPTPLFIECQALCADAAAANGKFTSSNGVTIGISTFPD